VVDVGLRLEEDLARGGLATRSARAHPRPSVVDPALADLVEDVLAAVRDVDVDLRPPDLVGVSAVARSGVPDPATSESQDSVVVGQLVTSAQGACLFRRGVSLSIVTQGSHEAQTGFRLCYCCEGYEHALVAKVCGVSRDDHRVLLSAGDVVVRLEDDGVLART